MPKPEGRELYVSKLELPNWAPSGWFCEKLSHHLTVIPVIANLAFLVSEAELEVCLHQHTNTYEQKEMLIDCSDWTSDCVLIQVFWAEYETWI